MNEQIIEDNLEDKNLNDYSKLSEWFKLFSNQTRLRILFSLFDNELCVCDIAKVLEMSESAISHQLKIMRAGKIIKCRKKGTHVLYSIIDGQIISIINRSREYIKN